MNVQTWSVVSGCERLTPGCDNCPSYWEYQEKGWDYHPVTHLNQLAVPLMNKTSTAYMVAAGSDLFHEAVRVEFIQDVFDVMQKSNWHHFEIITKRVERMEALSARSLQWPDNAIAGIAVEEARYKWRIDCLQNIQAKKMVSFGPMTGAMGELNVKGIDFAGVVVEHWGKPRRVEQEWVDDIHTQCEAQGVTIVKQHWLFKETA